MEYNISGITCKELRRRGRLSLKGKWGIAVLITLVFGLISSLFSLPQTYVSFQNSMGVEYNPTMSFYLISSIFAILSLVVMSPLSLGYYSFFLKLSRKEEADFGELFSKFSMTVKSIGLFLLMALKIFLWSLLFIVPGIIAAFRYAMAPFILLDNPDMTITEAINESKKNMACNKGKLFLLELSFIGWALLSILTLGIGLLWLFPYMEASYSQFYNALIGKEVNLD